MGVAYWYETTPTVCSSGGIVTYINVPSDRIIASHKEDEAVVTEWVERGKLRDGWPIVVTRAAIPIMLKDVGAKAITAAKISAAVLDVAPPALGTVAQKDAAVQAKLATIVPVVEYEKIEALYINLVTV